MNKEHNQKPHLKTMLLVVTYGILLYVGLENFSSIKSIFVWFFSILKPVAYGIGIAFIINLFLEFFQKKVFRGMANSPRKWEQKLNPVISAVCTGLVAAILLALIIFIIIPQLTAAINMLIERMPSSQEQFMTMVQEQLRKWHFPEFILSRISEFNVNWDTTLSWIGDLLDGKVETVLGTAFSATSSVVSATSSVVSAATNLVLGLIIAIYLLAQKERVLFLFHKVIQLISPERYCDRIFRILHLANQSFANFLTGQFIEAIIIGTLCTLGLTIFRFPYAATIGILTGITALLPIIGAWIGGGIGALLVLVEAPDRVIWFLLFILALQQIEGQFIYPKVVGNSIGLPGVLVLIAVILGGGFGGIFGIIFMVPVFAILYQLLKAAIDNMPERPLPNETAPVPAEGLPDTEPAEAEPEIASEPAEPEPVSVQQTAAKPSQRSSKKRRKKR